MMFHWGWCCWTGKFYDGWWEKDEGRAKVRRVVHNRRRKSAGLRMARRGR
jgi:hypothetical protein